MTSLSRLAIGTAALAGERLLDRPAGQGMAFLVGVADRGAEVAARLGRVLPKPPKVVRRFMQDTTRRGMRTIAGSRREALTWLQATTDSSVAWAERTLIPRVIDDMTPKIIATMRTTIMPVVIEDLASDSRVRAMIAEQSHGVLTDATDELRDTTATADERVESTFRRMFHLTRAE